MNSPAGRPAVKPAPITTINPTHGVHRCKACLTLIFFRRHIRTGKLAPLDCTPQLGGNIELPDPEVDPDGELYVVVPVDWSRRRYVNHYASCKHAQRFGGHL